MQLQLKTQDDQLRRLEAKIDSMDTNDEFLVSGRERETVKKTLQVTTVKGSAGLDSDILELFKADLDKERNLEKQKEDKRIDREVAYKRTQEKEITEIRERLDQVYKECYSMKNNWQANIGANT